MSIDSISKIKMLVMDVDGTLTDGKIYMGNDGELCKAFNVKDGYGLNNVRKYGIITAIITGRSSKLLELRANDLKIMELYQGIDDKLEVLKEIAQKYNLDFSEIAYIGDDLNDFDCIKASGLSACPVDAVDEIKEICDVVCTKGGGNGAVRELIDMIINGRVL